MHDELTNAVGAHGFNWFGNSRSKCFNDATNKTGCNAIDVRGKCQNEGGPDWQVGFRSPFLFEYVLVSCTISSDYFVFRPWKQVRTI
jgi:hypothetical protein